MPRQRDGAARGGEAAARRGICTCPDLHAGATRRVPSSGHNARPLLLLLLALCLSIHRLLRRLSRCRLIALKLLLSCLPCLGVEGAWAGRCLLRVQLLGGQSKVASRGVGGWGRGVHLATRLLLVLRQETQQPVLSGRLAIQVGGSTGKPHVVARQTSAWARRARCYLPHTRNGPAPTTTPSDCSPLPRPHSPA